MDKKNNQIRERWTISKTIFQTSPDAIAVTRVKDGACVDINESFTLITGYSKEDFTGNKDNTKLWYYYEDRKNLIKLLREKGFVHNFEIKFICKDKTIKTGLASARIIKIDGEEHILSVTRDITDWKKAEEKRLYLERQVRQNQKMEAVGTLAGGIAHEFNNMLGIMMGYTNIALKEADRGKISKTNLRKVLKAGKRAQELVSKILAFSREKEPEYKPVQVSSVARETIKLLKGSLPSDIDICEKLDAPSSIIMADPTEVHQIIMNLTNNAFYAMRDGGGTLKISLSEVNFTLKDLILYKNLEPGPHLKLTVRDTGHGMDEITIERIFDPCFTTKAPGEGTGMGLSVVHGIVSSYKGEIIVESKPGKGSAFHVYFPLILSEPAPEKKEDKEPSLGKERVLFVDDEEDLVYMARLRLERMGYNVTSVNSSKKGWEIFREKPQNFDVVITDQTMPGITGTELAKKILTIMPNMPIIICTGFSEGVTKEKALNLGIKEFITKPFDIEELAGVIKKLLPGK